MTEKPPTLVVTTASIARLNDRIHKAESIVEHLKSLIPIQEDAREKNNARLNEIANGLRHAALNCAPGEKIEITKEMSLKISADLRDLVLVGVIQ